MQIVCDNSAVAERVKAALKPLRIPTTEPTKLQQGSVRILIITSLEPDQEPKLREAVAKIPGATLKS